jgi:hypothetical protein
MRPQRGGLFRLALEGVVDKLLRFTFLIIMIYKIYLIWNKGVNILQHMIVILLKQINQLYDARTLLKYL